MRHIQAITIALALSLQAKAQMVGEIVNVRELWVSPTTGDIHLKTADATKTIPYDGYESNTFLMDAYPHVQQTELLSHVVQQQQNLKLLNQAITATGLRNMLSNYADLTWDATLYSPLNIYAGAQTDYCHVPKPKKVQKYTVFACPDDVLQARYGITDLQTFYDYARKIYGGEALNVNDPASAARLQEAGNPLRRLLAYNMLKFSTTYDQYTTITSIRYNCKDWGVNPTEWYATCDPNTTIKIDRMLSTLWLETYGGEQNDMYLNMGDHNRNHHEPGIHVLREGMVEAVNGNILFTDGLADYGAETQANVFDTRMRISLTSLFPEFYNNNMINFTPWDLTTCTDPKAAAANYLLPNGYLEGVTTNEDGIFFYQGRRSWYWCYQGDEFDVVSNVDNRDVEFTLPSVPTGTYQLRLGTCVMDFRGICQFYLDGEPQGIPIDFRSYDPENRTYLTDQIGWVSISDMQRWNDEERMQEAMNKMHNNGWYHGPASVFTTPYGVKDGNTALRSIGEGNYFCNQSGTLRRVLCTATLDGSKPHKLRCKMVSSAPGSMIQMDYLELVPKSVYAGNTPEDIY